MAQPPREAEELLRKLVDALTRELHRLAEADAAARDQARIWRELRATIPGTRIVRVIAPHLGYGRSGPQLQLLARAFGKRMDTANAASPRTRRGRRAAKTSDKTS